MRRRVIVGSVMLCAACQTYVATPIPSLAPKNEVRVTLTPDGMTEMTRVVGPHVSGLEGRIVSVDTAIQLAVHNLILTDGSFALYHDEIVVVPRSAVASSEIKRVSPTRSVVLAGALAAGGVVAATQMGNGENRRGRTNPGSETPK